jgi:monofunctional biosynthetic peptidoglycan transglycosylase
MSTLTFDSASDEAKRWYSVDDCVMGGVSHSGFRTHGDEGRFTGETSLENGGGFASVRREPSAFEQSLPGASGIAIFVYGDGRSYQLRLKSRALGDSSAYRAKFTPPSGEWQTLRFAWQDFEAVRRGKQLTDAPTLTPDGIYQLGFLIADRKAGAFCLRVRSLEALA